MSDRMNSIRPVGSIAPTRLRRVQRREKDGRSSNQNWQDALENELKNQQDDEEQTQENNDFYENEQPKEKKNDAPPPSRPIVVRPHLDVKA